VLKRTGGTGVANALALAAENAARDIDDDMAILVLRSSR
jgi:hypothetical protein